MIESIVYKLKLLYSMRELYSIFNIVKLSTALEDPIPGHKLEEYLLPIFIDGEEEWEVKEILNSHWYWR